MQYTQFLIFEITNKCNLSGEHAFCPCSTRKRPPKAKPLTDAQIIDIAAEAYNTHGFTGLIGWHYYCEPMLAWPRIKTLAAAIRERAPRARFILWTNGTQLPGDLAELLLFEQIHVTAYQLTREDAKRIAQALPYALIETPHIDDRLESDRPIRALPCHRPLTELTIDYWGDVHLCCYDWKGEAKVGNVHKMTLPKLLAKWQKVRGSLLAEPGVRLDQPKACRACRHVCKGVTAFAPGVRDLAIRDAERLQATGVPIPHVVAVAYRIPEHRVQDFCKWNAPVFEEFNARVHIVVDKPYKGLPTWAHQVKYTRAMDVFSLCATKNAGIKAALRTAKGVVIASDIDIVYPERSWWSMLLTPPGVARVPLYRMAEDYEHRAGQFVDAPYAKGTICMRAEDWKAYGITYDERCVGYGSDDAIIVDAIRTAGVDVDGMNGKPVYHIAHTPGTVQVEFNGRADHWNRDDGFNPENFEHNQQFYKRRAKP